MHGFGAAGVKQVARDLLIYVKCMITNDDVDEFEEILHKFDGR